MESKEVAAAILTRIAFQHNETLQAQIKGANGPQQNKIIVDSMATIYRECLKRISQAGGV